MSSMTDLVFLLLIFFVIVSTMMSPFALPVELPRGRTTPSNELPKVAVRLDAPGSATLTGKPVRPCLLYTSPSPRDRTRSRMPSSA